MAQELDRDPTPTRDLMTLDELMEATGWGRTVVYLGAKTDTLPIPTLRMGRRYYFSRRAYERYLDGETTDSKKA